MTATHRVGLGLLVSILMLAVSTGTAGAYDLDVKAPGPKITTGERVGASDCKTDNWERLVWKRVPREGVVPSHTEPCPVPEPEPVETATTTSPVATPAPSGGCPSYMAGESSSPTAVNPSSGAAGCFQVIPSTAENYGCAPDQSAVGYSEQVACAQKVCASEGDDAWVSADPCSSLGTLP